MRLKSRREQCVREVKVHRCYRQPFGSVKKNAVKAANLACFRWEAEQVAGRARMQTGKNAYNDFRYAIIASISLGSSAYLKVGIFPSEPFMMYVRITASESGLGPFI